MDLTDKEYWSRHWEYSKLPSELNIEDTFNNYSNFSFHNFFKSVFNPLDSGKSIIEVGCGDSAVLPYFANQFGLKVYGIDYSDLACERSKQILKNSGVEGDIVNMDLFDISNDYLGKFDFVYSHGVIEHFQDNTVALKSIIKMLGSEGTLITGIPNMTGLTFMFLKFFNRKVFEGHNVFNLNTFKMIHDKLGLEIIHIHRTPISIYIPLDGLQGFDKPIVYVLNKLLIMISKIYFAFGFKTNDFLASAFLIVSRKIK